MTSASQNHPRPPSDHAVLLSRRLELLLTRDQSTPGDQIDALILALAVQVAARTSIPSITSDPDLYRITIGLSVAEWAEHYEPLVRAGRAQIAQEQAIKFLESRDTETKA